MKIERLGISLHTRKSTLLGLAHALRETNIVDNDRVANNLSFRALAALLGLSYQGAYNNCLRSPANMKYVRILCAHEGSPSPNSWTSTAAAVCPARAAPEPKSRHRTEPLFTERLCFCPYLISCCACGSGLANTPPRRNVLSGQR